MITNQISNWNLAHFGIELKKPRWWIEITIIAIAYIVISALVVYGIPKTPSTPSPIWPGAGINVGLLLTWGRSRWLGIFLGAFLYNLEGINNFFPSFRSQYRHDSRSFNHCLANFIFYGYHLSLT